MIEQIHEAITRSSPIAIVSIVIAIVTQTILGTVWVTRQEARITALEAQVRAEQVLVARLDERSHEFNLTVTREAGIIRNNVDVLRADVARLQEQQNRIIQALDSTNNLIQEHIRNHGK